MTLLKKTILWLPVFLAGVWLATVPVSCTYRNRQDILNQVCDTSNVTYSGTVSGIMTEYCTGCHGGNSPSDGIALETYAQVKTFASSGQLWGTMNHDNGYKPMPQGTPKLDPCTLNKLYAWILKGAPND